MKKSEFFDRENSCYFFDDADKVVGYCKENCQDEIDHITRVADEVSKNYFLFDLKWDMERTYEPVIFEDKINWNIMPAGDPEFIWQFNRHRFFICLGQAYQLTKNEKYTQTFMRLVLDWIQNVPLCKENANGPWRSLETGLRGENWNKALRYFKDSPLITEDFLQAFYDSMTLHAEHLINSHSPYRYMSNWGVIENHGLFEIAMMLPQNEKTEGYREFALRNLEIEARMQIMGDGVQWEQSPMYHNEVLHCYFDVILLARRNGINLPDSIIERIPKMVEANVAWKKPNHHQPTMGDSDDTDIRDLISIGAYLFNRPDFKGCGLNKLDFDSIWDLGYEAAQIYQEMKSEEPAFTSISLNESGNYILRSTWKENANYLRFHCGTIGAGHGHSDQLHMDLVINGEDVLVDAGRYTYVAGPERYEFKDPSAHNTITVDEKFFTICKDSWECSKLSQPVKQKAMFRERCEFVQGGHLGYMDQGVFVNRKVVHIKPDLYIVVDECYAAGDHTFEQYFHFNSEGEVELKDNKVIYKGKQADAKFTFLTPEMEIKKVSSRVSKNYNEAEENCCIKTKIKGEGFASMITVIEGENSLESVQIEKVAVKSALKDIYYPSSMAEGIKISKGNESYVVIVCHQEVNSPTDLVQVDDCMGYGNVIVFDTKETTLVGDVLCW